MSRSCHSCGKVYRPFLGTSAQFCLRCGCNDIASLDDIFESKPLITLNNNDLGVDLGNPSSTPGIIFGEEAQLANHHDLLSDDLSGGLLSSHSDCEMSDVWLSMEQAFENDISAMLPNTDDQLSEQGLIVSDLIDSAVSIQELSQSIKTEALDFEEDTSNGLQLEIKVEVDDKLEFGQSIEKTLNFPLNSSVTGGVAVSSAAAVAATRALITVKDDQDKKLFSCQQCGKKYSTLPDLKCHKMLCYGSNASDSSRPYKCEKCGCSYTRKYHLDTHKDRYHSNTSYSCGKCLKIYRAREDYLRHLRKNNCTASRSKASKTSQELIMNSQRLHNVHRFPCRHCPKRFFRRHYLERHIEEKHHKDWSEQESCDICTPSRNVSNASSPSTDISVTPAESDFSSDDSGLMIEEMSGGVSKRMKNEPRVSSQRKEMSASNALINVIGHGDELIGNGLYIKPDSSLYQCVMCNYTTKHITQLSLHLEKHQASTSANNASRKSSNFILTV